MAHNAKLCSDISSCLRSYMGVKDKMESSIQGTKAQYQGQSEARAKWSPRTKRSFLRLAEVPDEGVAAVATLWLAGFICLREWLPAEILSE